MFDIYGKSMYHLLYESTHKAKAEVSIHEPTKVSPGSRLTLHRTFQDRSRPTTPHRTNGDPHCKSVTCASRQNLGRGRGRLVTHPPHSIGYRQTETPDVSVNIIYLMRLGVGITPVDTHTDTSHKFHAFSTLKKGGINLCLATALIPHITIPRYRTC